MEVSRISPAPRSSASRAQSTASRPVRTSRPCSHVAVRRVDRDDDRLRAEQLPPARGSASSGRSRARCSPRPCPAPASSKASASATERTPPPTVNGIASGRRSWRRGRASGRRLERRLHVEEHELVGARVGVGRAELDRVADVAQPLEADALDDAAARDVEAGDQARERHRVEEARDRRPLFSGWNWTPRKLPDSATATTPSTSRSAGVSAA